MKTILLDPGEIMWQRFNFKAVTVFLAIYLQSLLTYGCSVVQVPFYVSHLVNRGLTYGSDV